MVKIVTDEEIDLAFLNTSFGDIVRRDYLAMSLLKACVGYHCGYTITTIMSELGLINGGVQNPSISAKGKKFLRGNEKLSKLFTAAG